MKRRAALKFLSLFPAQMKCSLTDAVLSWEWWESRIEGVKCIGSNSGSSIALLPSNSLDSSSFVGDVFGIHATFFPQADHSSTER